jgi:hypothetical protein
MPSQLTISTSFYPTKVVGVETEKYAEDGDESWEIWRSSNTLQLIWISFDFIFHDLNAFDFNCVILNPFYCSMKIENKLSLSNIVIRNIYTPVVEFFIQFFPKKEGKNPI